MPISSQFLHDWEPDAKPVKALISRGLVAWAEWLLGRYRPDLSVKIAARALKLQPESTNALLVHGASCFELGDNKGGLAALATIKRLDPEGYAKLAPPPVMEVGVHPQDPAYH